MSHSERPNTPRYRLRSGPFGADPSATMVQISRVDGDIDGGPLGLRTSSQGDPLDETMAKLREAVMTLPARDDPDPVR